MASLVVANAGKVKSTSLVVAGTAGNRMKTGTGLFGYMAVRPLVHKHWPSVSRRMQ